MVSNNKWLYLNKIKNYRGNTALIVLFMGFFFSGCSFFPKEEQLLAPPLKEPPAIIYETIEVKKGLFEKKIEGTGYLISVNQKNFCFKNRGGRLKQVYVVSGDVVEKGDLLAELMTDNLESQIKQQEINLQKIQMNYELAVASDESKFNIKRAELDVAMEQLKLDDLRKELAESKIISAIDGTVNYTTEAKQGDYVEAFRTIVRVADVSNIQLEYTGDNLSDFLLGMKVSINLANNILNGRVVMNPANKPLNTDEKDTPSVRIKVTGIPKTVKIGDAADITLVLNRKENVIVIPKNLMHTRDARNYVDVLENDIKKERDIETGAVSQMEIEVTKGLNVGDKLINE
jgi:membrane fusion protein, macrolide-specific efflux system